MTALVVEHLVAFDQLERRNGWTRLHHARRACELLLAEERPHEARRVFWEMVVPTARSIGTYSTAGLAELHERVLVSDEAAPPARMQAQGGR